MIEAEDRPSLDRFNDDLLAFTCSQNAPGRFAPREVEKDKPC